MTPPISERPDDKLPASRDSDSLAMLSHDIRSAVFDVIGGLRLVDHSTFDAATKLQLERVRTSGEVLARLVDDALSIVAEGMAGESNRSATLHLHRLLEDTELRWSGRARENGLDFRLEIGENVPVVISAYRLGLERIFSNMLSNAMKFTQEGMVVLSVSLQNDADLCFTVRDNGPGFSPEALERLFQTNGRPEGAAVAGTGLGLHIAKEIADRMGAHLSISTLTAGGASVTLRLPPTIWSHSSAQSVRPGLPDLSNLKVLVAEDNETNQLIIGQMLENMGAECVVAKDGVEALDWLEREPFDIALVDIEMPRLSGLDVIRSIRRRKSSIAELPFLAITAFVLRKSREEIYAAGADRILAKPVTSIDSLGQAIASLLDRTKRQSPIEDPRTEPDLIDRTRFDRLLEIAGPASREELLSRLHKDLQQVERALTLAVPQTDYAALRAQTHVLISLAGAVGAEQLRQHSEVLNLAAHRNDAQAVGRLGGEALAQLGQLLGFLASFRDQDAGETR